MPDDIPMTFDPSDHCIACQCPLATPYPHLFCSTCSFLVRIYITRCHTLNRNNPFPQPPGKER
jgi:hypothetical protein